MSGSSAFDRLAQKDRDKALLIRQAARDELDFKAVASTVEGRRFISRFLAYCGTGKPVFHSDALEMARLAGKQEVGFFIQALFHGGGLFGLYNLMMEEARADSDAFQQLRLKHDGE